MEPNVNPTANTLAQNIEELLQSLINAAKQAFGDDLKSFILFGSGAEGRLRPVSDLNLLLVLKKFEPAKADAFREPLRTAKVAARASAMFLLEAELPDAMEAFAVKFDDISRRRRVLFGTDVFSGVVISREAKKVRLRQVLMNLILRLRERYLAVSLREEQMVAVIAETASPLRAAAGTLLELEGQKVNSPKEALENLTQMLVKGGQLVGDAKGWQQSLQQITEARTTTMLPPGIAAPLLFRLLELGQQMLLRLDHLS